MASACAATRGRFAETNPTLRGGPDNRPLPSGDVLTLKRVGAGFEPAVRYGIRTRDSQVIILVLLPLS